MRCSRCGGEITSDKIIENYRSFDLKVWYCLSCLKELTKYGRIHDLFSEVEETLPEEFAGLDTSVKAAFIYHCAKQGIIRGGTAGQMNALRVIAASGI